MRNRIEAGPPAARDDPALVYVDLTRVAMQIAQARAGGIAFVDSESSHYKTRVGLLGDAVVPRELDLCALIADAREAISIDDVSTRPQYANFPMASNRQVRFFAGVPLIRGNGTVLGAFFVADGAPRPTSLCPEQIEAMMIVAGQIVTLEESRAAIASRAAAELRQVFFDDLTQQLRELGQPEKIVAEATESLGKYLSAARLGYGRIEGAKGLINFEGGYSDRLDALVGIYSPSAFGIDASQSQTDGWIVFPGPGSFSALVYRGGRLRAVIYAHPNESCMWSRDDMLLAREVAGRIWDECERARAAIELAERAARMRTVLECVSDGFFAIDDHWRFTMVNRAAARYFGTSEGHVLGRSIWTALPDVEKTEAAARLARVMAHCEPEAFELISAVQPGRVLEMRAAPNQGGGAIISFTDITQRKKADELFKERAAHLGALYAQTAAGFAETDLAGHLVAVNERFCQIVGRAREELLTLSMTDITHPEDVKVSWEWVDDLVKSGRPFSIEKRYMKPDGTVAWVANSVTLIRAQGYEMTTMAVVVEINNRAGVARGMRAT